ASVFPKSSAISAWVKSNTSCIPITLDESGVGWVEIFLERGAEDRWVSMHERPDRSRQRDAPGPFTCSSGGNTRGVLDATSDLAREDEMATAKKIDVLTVKLDPKPGALAQILGDRKSTRLNSSHLVISYD